MLRNSLPPIHIHPVFILFIFISILTGTFVELSIIFIIVLVHEMGHYLMAKAFRWRIRKIMLWVFGGVMETEEHGNRSIKEDLLVTAAGPFQHVLIYIFLFFLFDIGIVSETIYEKAMFYNTAIFIFNMLPIWPLDGGKFLFSLLSMRLPYRKSFDSVLLFSMIFCLLLIVGHIVFYSFTLSFASILLFLFIENRLEWKRRFYVFMRFLLRRYEGNHAVRKIESIHLPSNETLMEVFSRFKRERKHTIYVHDLQGVSQRMDETDCLHAYFYDKKHSQRIYDILEK